jgi:predicted cobalt transporter CbtA
MTKKIIIAVAVIYVTWIAMDFVIHGLILGQSYAAMAQFWRPMEEMKRVLMSIVTLIAGISFVLIYARLVANKSLITGMQFGILFGVGYGISMGFGSYSVMPIPYHVALTWFLGTLVEMTVAGVLVGLIVKE